MAKPDIPEYGKKVPNEANPEAGLSMPAGKRDDENDALGYKASFEKAGVREAKAEDGACLKAVKVQAGEDWDNLTQPNSSISQGGELYGKASRTIVGDKVKIKVKREKQGEEEED